MAVKATAAQPKCLWCLKVRKPSNWEQEILTGKQAGTWARLCEVCWGKRERNPWNALMPLRRNPIKPQGDGDG